MKLIVNQLSQSRGSQPGVEITSFHLCVYEIAKIQKKQQIYQWRKRKLWPTGCPWSWDCYIVESYLPFPNRNATIYPIYSFLCSFPGLQAASQSCLLIESEVNYLQLLSKTKTFLCPSAVGLHKSHPSNESTRSHSISQKSSEPVRT